MRVSLLSVTVFNPSFFSCSGNQSTATVAKRRSQRIWSRTADRLATFDVTAANDRRWEAGGSRGRHPAVPSSAGISCRTGGRSSASGMSPNGWSHGDVALPRSDRRMRCPPRRRCSIDTSSRSGQCVDVVRTEPIPWGELYGIRGSIVAPLQPQAVRSSIARGSHLRGLTCLIQRTPS